MFDAIRDEACFCVGLYRQSWIDHHFHAMSFRPRAQTPHLRTAEQ